MIDRLAAEIPLAAERIRPFIRKTPVIESAALSEATGAEVLLKLENLQRTGSFKLRGAVNKLLLLPDAQRRRGVVAASSGNHGAAVAYAGRVLGVPVIVFVPAGASPVKMSAMQRFGADVRVFGTDGLDTEIHARAFAASAELPYISPYNDPAVVAGQGTVAVELSGQTGPLDAVIVAVGGGGLIAGIAVYMKQCFPAVRVIGAVPASSPVMAVSIRAGHIVEMPSGPTLSDGTAGGIEQGAITFELCQRLVDDWVEVSEGEIADAVRHSLTIEHLLIEGAAGVALAASIRSASALRHKRVAIVLCGANVTLEKLRDVLLPVF